MINCTVNNRFILFLSGKGGSGKDLAGNIIFEYFGKNFPQKKVLFIRFAETIKSMSSQLTKTTLEENFKDKKRKPKKFASTEEMKKILTNYLNSTLKNLKNQDKKIMEFINIFKMKEGNQSLGECQQIIGSAFRKLFSHDIFIQSAVAKTKDPVGDVFIVVDGRFKNEVNAFKKIGSFFIRLERDEKFRIDSLANRNVNDITEVDLDDYNFDHVIINNGTIEEFKKKVIDKVLFFHKLNLKNENGKIIGKKRSRTKVEDDENVENNKKLKIDNNENEKVITKKEELFCFCNRPSFGEMVRCNGTLCSRKWFHFRCVGLTKKPNGKWYCEECKSLKI